ncbi:MAG: SPFH domain-containing protein, partial [Planctomycetota bacterium]
HRAAPDGDLGDAARAPQVVDDDAQVVVEAFAVWKVDDALEFFQKFSNAGNRAELHYEAAEDILESALRSATGETSQFRLDELFSPTPGATRLPELERRVLAALEESVRPEGEDGGFGIAVEMVGINRITLDENTTETVMDRMVATRDRLASELRKQGESQATTIEAQAERDAATILAFASRRAAQIESLGQREASEFLAPQNEVAELAVFLAKLETLSSTMAEQFTVVLSENDFGFSLLAPSAVGATQGAGFPGRSFGDTIAPLRLGLNPGGPAPEDGSDD